jgi:hypothetical protein
LHPSGPAPDVPDDPPQEDSELVLSPGKVVRLGAMVDAIVEELHDGPVDSAARTRVRDLYRTALIEVGSTLSDPLLDELAHLQPAHHVDSDDDLRIVVAQLAGWIHGLRDGMASGAVPFMLPAADLPDAPPAA